MCFIFGLIKKKCQAQLNTDHTVQKILQNLSKLACILHIILLIPQFYDPMGPQLTRWKWHSNWKSNCLLFTKTVSRCQSITVNNQIVLLDQVLLGNHFREFSTHCPFKKFSILPNFFEKLKGDLYTTDNFVFLCDCDRVWAILTHPAFKNVFFRELLFTLFYCFVTSLIV